MFDFTAKNTDIAIFKTLCQYLQIVLPKNTVVLFKNTSYYCCIANQRKMKCYYMKLQIDVELVFASIFMIQSLQNRSV